ncbi:MAG: YdcF family protein [Anaeromyxobacteraceae bacterium]
MFFALSKVLDLAVAPLTWALALLVLAVLARRRARVAAALTLGAIAVLAVFSASTVSNTLLRYVESAAVRTDRTDVTYDAVVILGGAFEPGATRATGELELNGAGERLTRGWEVLRSGHARNAIVTSGIGDGRQPELTEAEWYARTLVAWGIPASRIAVERASRNTRENAVESARVLRERGWRSVLLVTSAAHMPRALGCFRRAGVMPDALPVDHRSADGTGESWLPRAGALKESTQAIHELARRMVYQVMGYAADAKQDS